MIRGSESILGPSWTDTPLCPPGLRCFSCPPVQRGTVQDHTHTGFPSPKLCSKPYSPMKPPCTFLSTHAYSRDSGRIGHYACFSVIESLLLVSCPVLPSDPLSSPGLEIVALSGFSLDGGVSMCNMTSQGWSLKVHTAQLQFNFLGLLLGCRPNKQGREG